MADTVDELQIEINAKATKANDAIDRLVGKLDRLTTSLGRVNGTNLNGLANGVQRLGAAMQTMNAISTADFTRLATNLTKLGTVNVSALNSVASSMSHLTRAFNSLGTVSANAQSVGQLASNLSKLGNAGTQRAITNIPQLAVALNNLMSTLARSPQVSQNVIQMTNSLANLASQGSRVSGVSNNVTNGLNRTTTATKKASGGFKGLASYIGKFYATYFMVIRAIKKIWSSIESTADYIEAYNYFNVALGKIGSDWSNQFEKYGYENAESYAESFKTRLSESLGKLSGLQVSIGADGKGLLTEGGLKNLGLNIQEITQYASQLASVTNSVGQTGEVSLAAASSFTKLAGDLSSLFNVDYSSVSKNLQSGLIGQSRALYKYGIDITNATLQTYAYNLGLSKSVSEMTQAEKMQLRMLAILDQSKVSWGDLANTINSPSNMIRQFKNNLKETGMVLGQLFVPILQKVLPVINGVAIAIKRLLVNIANLLGVKIDFDAFGQGYSDMEDDIDGITDSYEEAGKAAKEYKNQVLGFDEINKLSDTADSGDGVGAGNIDLTQQILDATSEYEKAWQEAFDKMESKAQTFADKIEKALKSGDWFSIGQYAGKQINKGINAIPWKKLGTIITDAICNGLDFASGFVSSVDWEELGKDIVRFIEGIDLGKIAVKVLDLSIDLTVALIKLLWGAYQEIYDKYGIGGILASLAVPGGIVTIKLATEFFASIDESKYVKKASEAVDNVKKAVQEKWNEITSWWNNTAIVKWWNNDVMPWFNKEKWKELANGIKLGLQEKWNEITSWWNNTAIVKWWNNDVMPWFTKEKWKNLADGIKRGIQGKWDDIVGWWNSKPALQGISVAIEDFKTKIQNAWNSFKQWWDGLGLEFPHIDTPHFKIDGEFSLVPPKVPKVSIDWYANGGFPEDGLFMANHNELVGKFSNGKTAVANNEQIIQGIQNGVASAITNAIIPYLVQIVNKDTTIQLDGREVGRASVNYINGEKRRGAEPLLGY